MANERVLIVDDSIEIVDFVSDVVLKPNGYQVLVAPDGEVGLKMALDQHPDLILLAMHMPKMSGIEMLAAINSQNVKIPVIIMRSHGSEMLVEQTFRMGVKDYIAKPFEVSEMLDSIERALAEVRLHQERDEFAQRLMAVNQQLDQHLKELNTLFGIGKSVTSLLDQDKLLSRLVEAAIYLTDAEEGALLLVDQETNELYMVAARGIDERVARSFRLKVEDSLAGEVITSGQPLILSGENITKIKPSYLVRSLMYVPLKIKGRIGGVFSVNNRQQQHDFTNHDLRLFSALADYAALSLENARLFSQAEDEKTKLVNILGQIEEPVVVVAGQSDTIVIANAAFRHIFVSNTAEVEGQPLAEVLQNQPLRELIASAPSAGNGPKREFLVNDGRTFQATFNPIPNVGRAIVMQDITHLNDLNRMKSDFVSTVSHDLHTPLTSIKEYAQMLGTAGELNEKQRIFVDRISKGMDDIATLIDKLLDLSTIEAGVDPIMTVIDIGPMVTDLVADFQSRTSDKRQQLISHTTTNEPALIIGNEIRLRQVASNLIDNAIKYASEEGRILIIVQVEDKQVVCKIEDDGPGIPPADLPFIFDKFYRIEDKNHPEITGTGLGLAICKSIIERHGGHIWVESHQGRGSIFTFTLPLASPDEANSENLPSLTAEALATS